MKVFISQPMKDRTDAEIQMARNAIIMHLQETYDDVEILPSYFEDYEPTGGCVPLKYLAKSLEMLADADMAYFAAGWDKARGCRIENTCAIEYGIEVVEDYRSEKERGYK